MRGDRLPGLVLQHGDSGPPGILGEWLEARGIEHQIHPTWRDPLPGDPGDYGWIATLGSEHTPGAPGAPPWIEEEIEFLSRSLELGVPVLGLCFGGQVLAVAAGGSVEPSVPPEIGWMEIKTSDPGLVPPGPWLHYHYDLLCPPAEAEVVAWSAAGPAAFTLDHSLGLQFHPESTSEIAAEWARQDAGRLAKVGVDPSVLKADGARPRAAALRLFDAWWDLAKGVSGSRMGTLSNVGNPERGQPTRAEEDVDVNPQADPSTSSEAATAREALSPAVGIVRITYPDLHGIQRGKDVPASELEWAAKSGLNFCQAVMGTDLAHTPVVGGEAGYPDMVARPDLSTLRELPWEPGVAACLADLERGGAPEPTDVRGLVRRATEQLAELGLSSKIGPELEFFLLEPDGEGGWRRHVDALSMVYTVGPQVDPQGVVKSLLEGCAALGLGAIASNHEFMNSQYEINLREGAPLDAADRAFRFKTAVKDYAAQRGLLATFMGKPFNDQGGSGTHLHISLERDGSNCSGDEGHPTGLSTEMRQFIGGVLDHAPALMAFLNPTVNAYRRILPDSLAPTHVNWGLDNRTTFVRVPPEGGDACRIELRIGDGAANPHLVIAAALFAGIDGLRRELDPGEPLSGDTYTLPEEEQGSPLPMSLGDALDALEADGTLRDAVGVEIVDTFVTMKRFEVDRHRQHVSEWELTEYMRHL